MSLLLADGGSTKVQWQLRDSSGDVADDFFTTGVNPLVMEEGQVEALIVPVLTGRMADWESRGLSVSEVRFYGAGCKGEGLAVMARVLRKATGAKTVSVGSDMLGACAALLGDRPGIACILGTGANSALYDGKEIIASTPPLGYILGDEGSGTWLGKRLISDRFKGLMPRELAQRFDAAYGLTEEECVRRVYRPAEADGAPNRFLASLTPFLADNLSHPYALDLLREGFGAFISRNVAGYFRPELLARCGVTDSRQLPVSFCGGVAHAFRIQLAETVRSFRLTPGAIRRSPLESDAGMCHL